LHWYEFSSQPPKQLSLDDPDAHDDPCMHQWQPVPARQSAQFVSFEQSSPEETMLHSLLSVAQSLAGQELTEGPLASPRKHEALLLHQPHPFFAMQESQSGVKVAQSAWEVAVEVYSVPLPPVVVVSFSTVGMVGWVVDVTFAIGAVSFA